MTPTLTFQSLYLCNQMSQTINISNFEFCRIKKSKKNLSLRHKLKSSNPYIFAACRWYKSLIFQTLNSVGSRSLNFTYKRFKPLGCKDIEIGVFEFVAKTQIPCQNNYMHIILCILNNFVKAIDYRGRKM